MSLTTDQKMLPDTTQVDQGTTTQIDGTFPSGELALNGAFEFRELSQDQGTFLENLDLEPPTQLAGNGYFHNHSLVNRIQVQNNTEHTFTIVNDFTSNGEMKDRGKEVGEVKPGEETPNYADVDVILPLNENTVFYTTGGHKTEPGSAIRTSRRGDIEIREGPEPNSFYVHVRGGFSFARGRVTEIPDPSKDSTSSFHDLFKKDK